MIAIENFILITILSPLIVCVLTPFISKNTILRDCLGPIGGVISSWGAFNIISSALNNQNTTLTETETGNGNNTITEASTLISTIINTVSENNGNSTNISNENNDTPDITSAFSNPNWLILVAAVGAAEIIRRRVS